LAVKFLTSSISFDDHVGHFVTSLVRGEAPLALQALAPAPDGVAFFAFPGIDHAILPVTAKWTDHVIPSLFPSISLIA
jgi:hypothetical protein